MNFKYIALFHSMGYLYFGLEILLFFQRHCHLEVKLGSAGSFADLLSIDFYFFLFCKHSCCVQKYVCTATEECLQVKMQQRHVCISVTAASVP